MAYDWKQWYGASQDTYNKEKQRINDVITQYSGQNFDANRVQNAVKHRDMFEQAYKGIDPNTGRQFSTSPSSPSPNPASSSPAEPDWYGMYDAITSQQAAPSDEEISGVGNSVQSMIDRMRGAYSSQYNNSLSNLNSARDYGVKRIDTQLGQAKQDLEDTRFQNYLASRQQMASSGMSGTGLANDADVRLQLQNSKQLGRLSENAQLQNEGVLNQYNAGLNDLNSQQSSYLANLSNQADEMYREMFGDLQSRYAKANETQQSLGMKFMEMMNDQYNKDREFNELDVYEMAQLNQKERQFNNLSASDTARLLQDAYEFNNMSATDRAKMAQDQYQWGNISPYQQAQMDLTARGQDVTMRGQDMSDARGWANIGISRERLDLDIEKAVQASGNKQLETQLKGFKTQYDTAQKQIDNLFKQRQELVKQGKDTLAMDMQIGKAMVDLKNAEQDIVNATTPYVEADLSQDNWYNNNSNFKAQQGGGDYLSKVISQNEGSYHSVNADDNGAGSIGKFQWRAGRAQELLKQIQVANPTVFKQFLGGTSIANEIAKGSNWSKRTFNSSESKAISALLNSPTGKKVQDQIAQRDLSGYIEKGKQVGVKGDQAMAYFVDLYNQSPARAMQIAKRSNGTLQSLHQQALADPVMGKYRTRRNNTYKALS